MQLRWTVILDSRRPWLAIVLIAGAMLAFLATIIGVTMLPGLLFGARLEPAEAEASIRGRMLAQVVRSFQGRWAGSAEDGEIARRQHEAEIARIKALRFVSMDVDTSIFSAFRVRRSFVVEAVTRQEDGTAETRYYCFLGTYLTGDCAKWNWYLAW